MHVHKCLFSYHMNHECGVSSRQGLDTHLLMLKLHDLLNGSSPSVDDIRYVRKYIYLAISYLRNRAQNRTGDAKHATAPTHSPAPSAPKTADQAPVSTPEPIEVIDTETSVSYLSTLLGKRGQSNVRWTAVKEELCGEASKSWDKGWRSSTICEIASTYLLFFSIVV